MKTSLKLPVALAILVALVGSAYAQTLKSIGVFPSAIAGGSKAMLTVWLSAPAPKTGLTVQLSSSDPSLVAVPENIQFNKKRMFASVVIETQVVATETDVEITATLNGESIHTVITLEPLKLAEFQLDRDQVLGGSTVRGIIALNGEAPTGGWTLTVTSDNAAAIVPESIVVPEGQRHAHFDVATSAVTSPTEIKLTVTDPNGVALEYMLTVNPLQLSRLFVERTPVRGGEQGRGVVCLNGPAPAGGIVISLASDNAAVSVPESVTIPEGASKAKFAIQTTVVTEPVTATITATDPNGVVLTTTLTVKPVALRVLNIDPRMVKGGSKARGVVLLDGRAPVGGMVITLTSDNAALTVPATVTVAEGKSVVTFWVQTVAVSQKTIVTVTATDPNGVVATAKIAIR